MKSGISFKELARIQAEQLSKQPPFTYEEMKESIRKQKERRQKAKDKK